jgi:CheY-like chemotaxis protein
MLCEVLAQWGCEADSATSPAEGLDLLERGGYDVLLTDFLMPGMTGVELVERARARSAALRVIMLTGSGADLDLASRRLDFTLLRKPLDLGGLRTALAAQPGR